MSDTVSVGEILYPEFPPHEPPFTNPPDFASNATFSPGTELNPFASNTPFGSSQFGSNPFPSNPAPFPTGFSHEFIPNPIFPHLKIIHFQIPHSLPKSIPVDTTNPTDTPNKVYSLLHSIPPSNTTSGPAAFSQPNSFDYTPAPHRDREVNIWKLACQERVEFLLRRYGIDTIKALVASEARARFPSPSTHPSNTRFRLYTPASYLERASYTYKSAEFEAIDFDMDDEEDDDEDLDECDLGADYDDDYDDDDEDAEGEDNLFLMDVENPKGTATPCVPAIVTPTVPTVPPILPPTPQKQATSPRSTSPPALGGRSLLDAMPTSRPLCASPPCSPPRRTPSPPQRLSTPATPLTTSTPLQTPPLTPASPPTPTPPPSHPTPTPQTPPPIHSPQTTSSTPLQTPPQIHQLTLPRTPPLSSLHVTLLSEPPRAFMGRGTPPDRRRLSEWGRWGCVQVYGKGGERRRLSLGHDIHLHHGQCGERLGMGLEQLRKEDTTRHENPPPLQLTEPHHTPQQHEDPHPHPNPHEDPPHTHTHTHAVPGEWTSFLFAMLEGDGTGSAGWYELGAQSVQGGSEGMGSDGVPQSMNMGVLGGAQGIVGAQAGLSGTSSLGMGAQSLGMGMGGQGMGIGMGPMTQTVSIGEADSTLRFALG
ncbi:hypothetical protein EDD22DRAFT_994478 [Suillus occidentalis]|nr:hypothetical protein EDD22DRAFT_994478 [Suillus occidentalis]